MLIFNNKNDVIGSLTNDDLKAALNIHLLRDRLSLILSGSAKTGIGIEVRASIYEVRMRGRVGDGMG